MAGVCRRYSPLVVRVTDYVTEKVYNGFQAGLLPVYWGAANVDDFVPKGSVIKVGGGKACSSANIPVLVNNGIRTVSQSDPLPMCIRTEKMKDYMPNETPEDMRFVFDVYTHQQCEKEGLTTPARPSVCNDKRRTTADVPTSPTPYPPSKIGMTRHG